MTLYMKVTKDEYDSEELERASKAHSFTLRNTRIRLMS